MQQIYKPRSDFHLINLIDWLVGFDRYRFSYSRYRILRTCIIRQFGDSDDALLNQTPSIDREATSTFGAGDFVEQFLVFGHGEQHFEALNQGPKLFGEDQGVAFQLLDLLIHKLKALDIRLLCQPFLVHA
ncbi:MAG TPA: hypothetical protein VN957_03015 [Chthoniobacterales bacterium]|nr:hypothetical protein [Chthoniobacterales bacterium]